MFGLIFISVFVRTYAENCFYPQVYWISQNVTHLSLCHLSYSDLLSRDIYFRDANNTIIGIDYFIFLAQPFIVATLNRKYQNCTTKNLDSVLHASEILLSSLCLNLTETGTGGYRSPSGLDQYALINFAEFLINSNNEMSNSSVCFLCPSSNDTLPLDSLTSNGVELIPSLLLFLLLVTCSLRVNLQHLLAT